MGGEIMVKRIFLDGNKNPLIKNLIIHHSAGNPYTNLEESDIREIISSIGYNRGYKKWGYDISTGEQKAWTCGKCKTINYKDNNECTKCKKEKTWESLNVIGYNPLRDPITKETTFAMYHFAVYKYNKKYKLVHLIQNPLNYDSGSTMDRDINQVSVALCFLGNYVKEEINIKALECVAKSLDWIVNYTNKKLNIIGHKDVQPTACPGRIYNQLNILKNMMGVKNV